MELVTFLLGSIGFIFLTRRSFSNQHAHGLPRFFAFEAILGLVALNASSWFVKPFSTPQLISWALLLGSAILVISALTHLRRFGEPDDSIQDKSRITFEKTTHLVITGPYRYIRHPMYASLLYLAWGVLLKNINLTTTLTAIVASLALLLTAVYEERENLHNFGELYADYMRRTRRFIPFVF